MNILLMAVNAKYIHSNLAVYSLKGSAGAYRSQVELAEFTINHQPEDIFRAVCRKKPELLFLSCYIWNLDMILELTEDLRKVMPHLVIWAGGPEVSYDTERFLRENPQFDGVMRGEGEQTFFRLLQYYVDGVGLLEDIPGITYRRGGQIFSLPAGAWMDTLDGLPFVYEKPEEFNNRIIYYESSRGCPFSCSYCLSSIDKRVRFRSLELVKKELAFFLEHQVPQVKFVDRTFNCSHPRTKAIWQFILEHDNGVTNFHFEIGADLLDEEELELLGSMRPGLLQLEIGVQTVNEKALEAIHRKADFNEIAKRVNRIREAGNIHQHLDLIAGLPCEDFESFRTSFDRVYSLHPQELQLGFLKVLKGSEIYLKAGEYGIVYRSRPPYEVLATRWISCEELLRLKEVEEMLEVYYNSQQFRYTIRSLEKAFDRPVELYEALADYYKENGLEGRSYSRLQRFEILRDFILKTMEKASSDGPGVSCDWTVRYWEELLTLDCYLRENAKSRPFWSEDLTAYRREAAEFYQREQQEGRYLPEYREMSWKQTMRMTHLEHFTHDVLGDGKEKEVWLLFDYRKRNPLYGDASVQEVL